MPTLYLSPSTQEFNPYITGGNEEYYMNLIADAMLPYLYASGVTVLRNAPDMTAASSIAASNAAMPDLHLALHSNAAPDQLGGRLRGADIYYAPNSAEGRRAAEIIAENLRVIYPAPQSVRAVPAASIGEVTRTRAPAVLAELGYHDNREDALWIQNNIPALARNLALSVTEYFRIPFITPTGA